VIKNKNCDLGFEDFKLLLIICNSQMEKKKRVETTAGLLYLLVYRVNTQWLHFFGMYMLLASLLQKHEISYIRPSFE
jgi:hypothetical protein